MDASHIERLFTERSHAAQELRSLYNDAGDRELTAEERQVEDRIDSTIVDLDGRISKGLETLKTEQRNAEAWTEAQGRFPAPVVEERDTDPADAEILRELADGERRAHDFHRYEARDMTKAQATKGAATVPVSFYGQLVEHLEDTSSVMQARAFVLNTASGENLTVPVTTAISSATIEGEGDPIAESEPTSSTVTLGAWKYAFLLQASSELLTDESVGLQEYLARQGGVALGTALGADLIAGDDSSKPEGILEATNTTTAAATGAITVDELIDLQHSITGPYRRDAVFIANDSTVAALRKLKNTTTDDYIWQPSTIVGQPDTILGKPILTDPAMEEFGASQRVVAFGDLSRAYMVRLAGGVRIEVSTDYAFGNDLVTWRFVLRADGGIVDQNAVGVLVNAAS